MKSPIAWRSCAVLVKLAWASACRLRMPQEDLDLIEPGSVCRREVETHSRMRGQPAILLGLVSGKIVEHDVDLALGMLGKDLVHEVEKLLAPPALIMPRLESSAVDVEGPEKRAGDPPAHQP